MADRDPKVLAMVEREIKKDPKVSRAELQKKARRINKEEAELDPRSFNARYPLPVRRKLSGKTGGRKKGAAKRKAGKARSGGLDLGSLIEIHIRDAKATLDATLDSALKKARKTGRVSDFETMHQALIKAGKAIGKI